jgi:hypothetical protein
MRGRTWLWLSALFLVVYTVYVLAAKFGKAVGLVLPFELGNVGEFWLFAAFIGCFCMQIIRDERALPANAQPLGQPHPGSPDASHADTSHADTSHADTSHVGNSTQKNTAPEAR